MGRNRAFEETALVSEALEHLSALLPDSWDVVTKTLSGSADAGFDGKLSLFSPGGARVDFAYVVKFPRLPSNRLVSELVRLEERIELPVVFISEFIGPRARRQLNSAALSYMDATGWISLVSNDPMVLLIGVGADRSPEVRGSTAVVRLNGVAVNRIIRALCAEELPIGVRDLADAAGVAPSSVSKLLATLEREGIVDRDEEKSVSKVFCRDLILRWVQDYSFPNTNKSVEFFVCPRGLRYAKNRLAKTDVPATLTGSAAARQLLPGDVTSVVPERLLAIYTNKPRALIEELGLVRVDPSAANVVLAVPQAIEILEEPTAPTPLVLADLLTLPGRGDSEAEQLMDTLADTSQKWSDQWK